MRSRFSNAELQGWGDDGDPDLLVELAHERIQHRLARENPGGLNEEELLILTLYELYCEVNNGGFYFWLFNAGERAYLAPRYLNSLGAVELASIVETVLHAFGTDGPSADTGTRRQQLASLPPSFESICNDADQRYVSLEEDFLEHLYAYCRRHLTMVRADWA